MSGWPILEINDVQCTYYTCLKSWWKKQYYSKIEMYCSATDKIYDIKVHVCTINNYVIMTVTRVLF